MQFLICNPFRPLRFRFQSTWFGKACGLWMVFCIGCAVITGCGRPEKEKDEQITVGGESIPLAELRLIRPDSLDGKREVQFAAAQYLLSRNYSATDTLHGEFPGRVEELHEVLALRTDGEWSKEAAGSVLRAGMVLQERLGRTGSPRETIDSLGRLYALSLDTAIFAHLAADSVQASGRTVVRAAIQAVCGYDSTTASLVAAFTAVDTSTRVDSAEVKKLVSGLVHGPRDSTGKPSGATQRAGAGRTRSHAVDNSAVALKYRSSGSIRDSIGRHIPILKGMYKKHLKMHPDMHGRIYVTFRVAADGAVTRAAVKSSEIDEQAFIQPFLDYIDDIRFQPIPEHIGGMTFDFPFEFDRDG